jgi:hypothetical protein
VPQKLGEGSDYAQRAWQELIWMAADGNLPENEQSHDERDWAEPG